MHNFELIISFNKDLFEFLMKDIIKEQREVHKREAKTKAIQKIDDYVEIRNPKQLTSAKSSKSKVSKKKKTQKQNKADESFKESKRVYRKKDKQEKVAK